MGGILGVSALLGCWVPDAAPPSNSPSSRTSSTHKNNAQGVLEPGATTTFFLDNGSETAPATAGAAPSPRLAAWQTQAAPSTSEARTSLQQWRFLASCRLSRQLALPTRVQRIVVQALRDEDQIREAEVDCEGDDGGDKASPDGADEVGDVADEPDYEEEEGDALGGGLAVILDELRDLRLSR